MKIVVYCDSTGEFEEFDYNKEREVFFPTKETLIPFDTEFNLIEEKEE